MFFRGKDMEKIYNYLVATLAHIFADVFSGWGRLFFKLK